MDRQFTIAAFYKDHRLAERIFNLAWPHLEQQVARGADPAHVWVRLTRKCWALNRDRWRFMSILQQKFEHPKRPGTLNILFVPVFRDTKYEGVDLGLVWIP